MAARLVARFRKRLGDRFAVEADLSLGTGGGPVTVLFGPSGAGKTTVLRCLAGLLRPDAGLVRWDDETWFDADAGVSVPPQRRRIGFVFQDYALFPHLTVRSNVGFGLPAGGPGREERVAELVRLLELGGLEERRPEQLSGGERQRVALARALAPHPRLLLLDEPLSALDAPSREPLRAELRRRLVGLGIPTLVVTHDRTEAIALGDQLAVLIEGRVRQTGPVPEVFGRPADLAVARAVGVETVVPGRVVGESGGVVTVEAHGVTIAAAAPEVAARGDVFVCIRAEDVMLETGAPSRGSARNHLRGRIRALVPEGPLVRVLLDCGFPLSAIVTRPAAEDLALRESDEVTAVFKATTVHVVPRATG
jgi:molybdate transport system ATP-binding protein